jgi:uncharacterized phage-associated protein
MPGWSPEIANEFIRLAARDGHCFNQMQLQKLVYIANGWLLADTRHALTLDRPEAWEFGPVYRKLADALTAYGTEPVGREITNEEAFGPTFWRRPEGPARSRLELVESATIDEIYYEYGQFDARRLSALTQGADTPWAQIYAGGAGEFKDVPSSAIRAYFVELRERYGGEEAEA